MNNNTLQQYNLVYAIKKIITYQRKIVFVKYLLKEAGGKFCEKYNVDHYIDNRYYINPICNTTRDYDIVISIWKEFLDRGKCIVNMLENTITIENILIQKICIVFSIEENDEFMYLGYVDSEGIWKKGRFPLKEFMKKISVVDEMPKLKYNVIKIL